MSAHNHPTGDSAHCTQRVSDRGLVEALIDRLVKDAAKQSGMSSETKAKLHTGISRIVEAAMSLDDELCELRSLSGRLMRMSEPPAGKFALRKTLTPEQKVYYDLLAEETRRTIQVNTLRSIINGGAIPCP